ncbi:MAG: rhomboid family intramembrane serine protease [Caldimonas sp.]
MERLIELSGGAPASALILAAIIVASGIGLFVAPALVERNLLRPYWLVRRSEYTTVLTSGFIHADLTHLLFNAFTFWAFAFGVERAIGSERFLALYLFGLIASGAGTWFVHRNDPDYRTLGASGAILAVLFASIVYFPAASIFILPIPVPIPAPLFAAAYLGYTWYASRRGGGRINHDAHFAGALAGVAFVAFTDPEALRRAVQHVVG